MTDKEILEITKAELKRLRESCASPIVVCDTLLAFINSAQEDSNVQRTVKNWKEPVSDNIISVIDKQAKRLWNEINTGHEYSIIDSYSQFYGICMEIAESIKEEPVSGDLEEAAEKYAYELFPSVGVANTETELAFKAGAKWQEEQMMIKAIDGEVLENYDGKVIKYDETILDEKLSDCKVFDKVKVIIIREDEL